MGFLWNWTFTSKNPPHPPTLIVINRNIYKTEVKTKFQSALSLVICEAFECFILTQKCSSVMLHANIANPVLAVDSDW